MTKDELRDWMTTQALSPARLAELLPTSRRTIENWVQGRRAIPSFLPRALSDVAREIAEKKP